MLTALLILNSTLLLFVFVLYVRKDRQHKSTVKTSSDLIHKLHFELNEKTLDYKELEKGAEEQQQAYEQEWLSFDERVGELSKIVDRHNAICLPDLKEIRTKNSKIRHDLAMLRARITSRG